MQNVIESALDKAVTLARPFDAGVLDPQAAMTRRQADSLLNGLDAVTTSLAAPIFNRSGSFIGVSGVHPTFDAITKVAASVVLYRSGKLTLYSSNGTVAAAYDSFIVGRRTSEIGVDPALRALIEKGDTFVMESHDGAGRHIAQPPTWRSGPTGVRGVR